jgi:hypothetical protein
MSVISMYGISFFYGLACFKRISFIPRSNGLSIILGLSLADLRAPFEALAKMFLRLVTLLPERAGYLLSFELLESNSVSFLISEYALTSVIYLHSFFSPISSLTS